MESRKRGNEPEYNESPKAKRLRRSNILRQRRPGILWTTTKTIKYLQQIITLVYLFLHATEPIISHPPNHRGKLLKKFLFKKYVSLQFGISAITNLEENIELAREARKRRFLKLKAKRKQKSPAPITTKGSF